MQAENINSQTQLSRRWRPALMSFFLRRVRNHAEAEDLTQEVFKRLLCNGDVMAHSPDAYVFRVATNLVSDMARRAKVRSAYQDAITDMDRLGVEPLDPYRILAGRDALARLSFSLEELPERTRTIFTLYRLENMSLDTIAEAFGISKSAVKKHVTKAMAFLMGRMRDAR